MFLSDPRATVLDVRELRDHDAAEVRCSRCREVKPREAFPIDRARPGRLHAYCKPCKAAVGRARRERIGPEAVRLENLDSRLRRTYGITLAQYEELLTAQGGGCATCGTPEPTGNHGRLVVDHDHESGAVRGLLCGRCNAALGLLDDDPHKAEALATYLRARSGTACAAPVYRLDKDSHAGERPAAGGGGSHASVL